MFVEERKEGRMGINANVLGKWRERESCRVLGIGRKEKKEIDG